MKKQYKHFIEEQKLQVFDLKYFSSRDKIKKILEKQFKEKEKNPKSLYLIAVNGKYANNKIQKLFGKSLLNSRRYNISLLVYGEGFENKGVSQVVEGYTQSIKTIFEKTKKLN